jgi:hypothetical protein
MQVGFATADRFILAAVLLTSCVLEASAFRLLLHASSARAGVFTFECGKPNGPCGNSIPAGVLCEMGPGWCQPGYFCSKTNASNILRQQTAQELCLPVPKDCGKAGQPCCPSNTDAPHDKAAPQQQRLPFCRDGSSCFFDSLELPDVGTYSGGLVRVHQHTLWG